MDLRDLIELVIAWEEWVQRYNFEKYASNAPQVHLVPIVAIGQQAFRRSVPPSADVLCVWLFAVNTATTAKISKLHAVIHYQNILRFYVSVEDAISMHVVDRLQQLEHIVLNSIFR